MELGMSSPYVLISLPGLIANYWNKEKLLYQLRWYEKEGQDQRKRRSEKKFHLVDLNLVWSPKYRVGLGVKDPAMMNYALGGIGWRFISGSYEWWKKVIYKKYLQWHRKRCLDNTLSATKGSHIWKLLRIVVLLIQTQLTWVPANDKMRKTWQDSIMGKSSIFHDTHLQLLRDWMVNHGMVYLNDIPIWSADKERWEG